MPGLSQLIQFNKDILSLGDEIQLRAQRGEKPVRLPIPKVPDVDDSEEFVMGMPEKEAIVEDTSVDEDLSDLQSLTGGASTSQEEKQQSNSEDTAPSFDAPDLSGLLAPMPATDAFGESSDMPDLSMFMEPEETVAEEPEPEETSIADLDLEALLSGAGFDGSSAPSTEETTSSSSINDDDLEFYSGGFGDDNYVPQKKKQHPQPKPDFSDISDLASLDELDSPEIPGDIPPDIFADLAAAEAAEAGDALPLDELGLDDTPELAEELPSDLSEDLSTDLPEDLSADLPEDLSTDLPVDLSADLPEDLSTDLPEDLSADLPEDLSTDLPEDFSTDLPSDLSFDTEGLTSEDSTALDPESLDLESFDADLSVPLTQGDGMDFSSEPETEATSLDLPADAETPDISFDEALEEFPSEEMGLDNPVIDDTPDAISMEETPVEDISQDISAEDNTSLEDFSADIPNLPELNEGFGSDFSSADGLDSLDSLDSFDSDSLDDISAGSEDTDALNVAGDTENVDELSENPFAGDFGSFDDISDSSDDLNPISDSEASKTDDFTGDLPNFNLDDMDTSLDASLDTEIADDSLPSFDNDFTQEIPETSGEFGDMDFGETSEVSDSADFETFDTTEMDGMEFDIPDTDSQLSAGDGGMDFDDGEFNIPGFSDVETAKDDRRGPAIIKNNSGKSSEDQLPPNTLSDAQYKTFLKNLNEYPLNVRLAFEDLIVKNEFTDDAEFEIVEKILNKAPARQVASHLEKMLDISIPVPRNYEQRTAEEYEAYKKSLSYQLRNKIIPAIFACMVLLVVGFGIFKFVKNCIYVPAMANHLYKQGYVMLEADEYPQSEIKFNEAVNYKINKKWFFKYARGYREKKQYIRAEKMYQNILDCFKHDKTAGLEYARMELDDLANYEKAEEICRRQVLDFHINDADGIMLLGDIFLEWGTEKEPEKLEAAREQYATLIQLYKSNYLYQSRMMRYFIRTDKLAEVLDLKAFFFPKEKNLSAEDWTELSGYLLDKSYGNLAPSEEHLRRYIEDVRTLLTRAYKLDQNDPISAYNLSRYFIYTNEPAAAKDMLDRTLKNFNNASLLRRRDLYKYIDTYRLAGEEYAKVHENLRAQEYFTDGITLYIAERDASGLAGNKKIGKLFEDQADMDYFITGDYDNALMNYISSVELENDNPSIRYKIGYIQYKKKNYNEALGSFMKAGNGNIKETNLMLAMGNTLSLRGDNYAAQGYYENLIDKLDKVLADEGITFPQIKPEHNNLITTYLRAANNYGVTLYHLASRTGNSSFNAKAIVQFSQSERAWDALTRNQETMIRLGGSNLAEENIKYITHPVPEFEPAIYTEIQPTIVDNEKISY